MASEIEQKWTKEMWTSCHHKKKSPDFIIFISFNATLMMAVISLTDVIKLFGGIHKTFAAALLWSAGFIALRKI